MDEGLKNKAYLEGQRLKRAGYDDVVILARLEKLGIPEELALRMIENLSVQRNADKVEAIKPFYNIALLRIGIGVFLAAASLILVPGNVYFPTGLIVGGIIAAFVAKYKVKR